MLSKSIESLAVYLTLNSGAFLEISLNLSESVKVVSTINNSEESFENKENEGLGLVLANPLLINNPIRTTNILDLMFNLVNKPIIFLNGKCFNNMKVKSKITQNLEGYTKNYALDLKRLLPICLVFLMSFLTFFTVEAQSELIKSKSFNVQTIVIDAGHGGHDPGCLGSSSQEKHVCLGVALKLGKLINAYYPDVKVIYTRDKDVFVKLHERANIANRNKANLFISIHANSAQNKSAYGTETYVMGTKYTDRNLELSKRENSVILLEKDHEKNYDGYDPTSPMSNILMSLYQQEYLESSINFASKVEHQFKIRNERRSRGVRQRVLLVMYKTTMPSVLIEVGFLTNSENQKLLKEEYGQAETAGAIFRAFVEYKSEMEGISTSEVALKEAKAFADWEKMLVNVLKIKVGEYQAKEIDKRVKSSIDSVQKVVAKQQAVEKKSNTEKKDPKSCDVLFRVQITSSSKKIPLNSRKFKDVKDVFEYESNGIFKYAVGNCVTQKEVIELQKEVKKTVFSDAFVIAFYKQKRVSVKKAKELIASGQQ